MHRFAYLIFAATLACGSPKKAPEEPTPGETHVTDDGTGTVAQTGLPDAGVPEPPPPPPVDAGPPPPPYTFELENAGSGDLVFAIDKGWQPVLFAYSGKPPKAKSVLLFPTYCTESCDAAPDAMCPICKEPEKPKDRQKAEKLETKREIAPAGGSVTVEWDGKVFAYERAPKEARGKKKRCQCWRKVDPPPETYTVKACGLRPSTKAGEPSTPMCAETQVALPAAETPTVIKLTFPDPPKPKKGK